VLKTEDMFVHNNMLIEVRNLKHLTNIIGKISKATFGLTFENLLNRLYLTTGVYPYQNRGGLFNVISRFNVTWYFLN